MASQVGFRAASAIARRGVANAAASSAARLAPSTLQVGSRHSALSSQAPMFTTTAGKHQFGSQSRSVATAIDGAQAQQKASFSTGGSGGDKGAPKKGKSPVEYVAMGLAGVAGVGLLSMLPPVMNMWKSVFNYDTDEDIARGNAGLGGGRVRDGGKEAGGSKVGNARMSRKNSMKQFKEEMLQISSSVDESRRAIGEKEDEPGFQRRNDHRQQASPSSYAPGGDLSMRTNSYRPTADAK